MDCTAEEHLIRMKLETARGIEHLRFDLPTRTLELVHAGDGADLRSLLEQLNLGAVLDDDPSFPGGLGATLLILYRGRGAGVHMKAAWIRTSVDVQVNVLVLVSGIAVFWTGSRIPDLLVGGVIFLLVGTGARRILLLAKQA